MLGNIYYTVHYSTSMVTGANVVSYTEFVLVFQIDEQDL